MMKMKVYIIYEITIIEIIPALSIRLEVGYGIGGGNGGAMAPE